MYTHVYTYAHIICSLLGSRVVGLRLRAAPASSFQRELGGSQGTGALSNNWSDRVLLSIIYAQTLMLADAQTPSLGPP